MRRRDWGGGALVIEVVEKVFFPSPRFDCRAAGKLQKGQFCVQIIFFFAPGNPFSKVLCPKNIFPWLSYGKPWGNIFFGHKTDFLDTQPFESWSPGAHLGPIPGPWGAPKNPENKSKNSFWGNPCFCNPSGANYSNRKVKQIGNPRSKPSGHGPGAAGPRDRRGAGPR